MKRERRELSISIAKYMIFGTDYLLNDKQKEVVAPYIFKFKVGYKVILIKLLLAKVIKFFDSKLVNFMDLINDYYSSFYNRIFDYLNSNPKFVKRIFNGFIEDVEKYEDLDGSSKYERLINESRQTRSMKIKAWNFELPYLKLEGWISFGKIITKRSG